MATSWTDADLEALEAAIAKGVRRVSYTDFSAEYHSLDEMLRLRDRMQRELAPPSPSTGGQVIFAGRVY